MLTSLRSGNVQLHRQVRRGAEEHLVRRLAAERGVGHLGVVLVYEERDQGPDAFDAVEGVEEEPLMFEGAPPRLDHRVRLGDLDLGEDAVKAFGEEGGIDGGVDVLDARPVPKPDPEKRR
jgi:hypothetical protein